MPAKASKAVKKKLAAKKPAPKRVVSSPTTPSSLQVETWPIEKLIVYARNARKIPQSAIEKTAASIKEFGWRQPIVVDPEGVIVAGHTRFQAAQKLELKQVPVHVARDLTTSQIRAYRLADNRTGQETSWDQELLHLELLDLSEDFADLNFVTGFDTDELSKLLDFAGSEDASEQKTGSTELNAEDFQKFSHACPRCGFEFD